MRLLVVAQRYGEQVAGGAEHHARMAAERLALRHDVEVATTNALDHWTWSPHFPAGTAELNGVVVRRFPVARGRSPDFKAVELRAVSERHTYADELAFLDAQGPHVPALHEFLHDEGQTYDAVLFYTYLYAPTALGLPLVPERAVLVPTAHDEAPLRLTPYRALFALPRAIGFLSVEERDLVHRVFRNAQIPCEVIGIGLDEPPPHDGAAFRARFGLAGRVVVYVGQVSEAKGCDELLEGWRRFRDRRPGVAATLVLVGPVHMPLPARDDVKAVGPLFGADKYAALAGSDALVLPSLLESLGIVLLEAWQVARPVLVPERNPVTAGQVRRSGGGVTYRSADDLGEALIRAFAEGERLGASGRAFVARECEWGRFDAKLAALLDAAAWRG